jgi:hypothetical protein
MPLYFTAVHVQITLGTLKEKRSTIKALNFIAKTLNNFFGKAIRSSAFARKLQA